MQNAGVGSLSNGSGRARQVPGSTRTTKTAGVQRAGNYLSAFVLVLVGCGETAAKPAATSETPKGTPCARRCDLEARCARKLDDDARASCERACKADEDNLADGFTNTFVSCVETSLDAPTCARPEAFAQLKRVCLAATFEAVSRGASSAPLVAFAEASCARQKRCEDASLEVSSCQRDVLESLAKSPTAKLLLSLKPRTVSVLTGCLRADCGPVSRCVPSLAREG